MQVRGCSNFVGYLKRPELDNTDANGWFDTGDLARMDAEGYIRIAGRSKDIIIRGGENIPVVEVEGLLFKHPKIAAVAIVGYPDTRTRRTRLRLCGAARRSFAVICGDGFLFEGPTNGPAVHTRAARTRYRVAAHAQRKNPEI